MLKPWQTAALILLGVALWGTVAMGIRAAPDAAVDPAKGLAAYIAAPLGGLLSVWLCKLVGKLSQDQLIPGVTIVGAVAMMLDGAVLKWLPAVYGINEKALRLDAAWLLWGYGVAFAVAVIWAGCSRRHA